MSMGSTAAIDGRKLRRAWWITPLIMTGWVVLIAYAVSLPFVMGGRYGVSLSAALQYKLGLMPLWIGLMFGALGTFCGYMFSVGSRAKADAAFGVTYLNDEHALTKRVHAMADRLDMPRPRVGYMQDVNAYAIGASMQDASVVLGVPLIKGLEADELDAIIGHELGHIVSGDMRQMQFSMGFQKMFDVIAMTLGTVISAVVASQAKGQRDARQNAGLVLMFSSLVRMTIGIGSQLAMMRTSRQREFHADSVGAGLTSPDAMKRALTRLSLNAKQPRQDFACLMIAGGLGGLFSTHPSVEDRITALETERYVAQLPRMAT